MYCMRLVEYQIVIIDLLFIGRANSLTELTFFTVVNCFNYCCSVSNWEKERGHINGQRDDCHLMSLYQAAPESRPMSHLGTRCRRLIKDELK